jgi:hypothetical protein
MSKPAPHSRPSKPKITPRDIRGGKFIAQFMDLLAPLHDHRPDPKRNLHYDEFCAHLLLYFFTPILTSLRGLHLASSFEKVQKLGLPRFSLGSFSEAGAVFDPELLTPIITRIGQRLADIESDPRLRSLERRPTAVDGTLLHALPKMVWALWSDERHRAAKLHLQLDLLTGAPARATLTAGGASEREQLRQTLQPGRLYLDDRGYFEYQLLTDILAAQSSFVARAPGNIVYDVLRQNPISPAAARAGVQADLLVQAGYQSNQHKLDRPLRLVRIHVAAPPAPPGGQRPNRVDAKTKLYRERQTDYTLVLLSDLVELDVELIALLYRYRWQVELFFRWFKKVLQADRLLALSQNGMTIVAYCALIASMLVVLWTGRKPTKRTYELICFYFSGWVSDEELLAHLERLQQAQPAPQTK